MKRLFIEQSIEILNTLKIINIPKLLIGIDGSGGSGKTTLGKELIQDIPGTVLIHMDDFYKPFSLRNEEGIGAYFDWQRLKQQVIEPFKSNAEVKFQKYDWEKDILDKWEIISPGKGIIIEGVYSTRIELAEFYDFKIWVECPAETRLKRGIERDGIIMKEQWQKWMKQEDEYVKNHKPQLYADIVVRGESQN